MDTRSTTRFIAVWEELVDVPSTKPFIRLHTRLIDGKAAKTTSEAWDVVVRDNHLQEQNVLRATVKKLDDTFYGGSVYDRAH